MHNKMLCAFSFIFKFSLVFSLVLKEATKSDLHSERRQFANINGFNMDIYLNVNENVTDIWWPSWTRTTTPRTRTTTPITYTTTPSTGSPFVQYNIKYTLPNNGFKTRKEKGAGNVFTDLAYLLNMNSLRNRPTDYIRSGTEGGARQTDNHNVTTENNLIENILAVLSSSKPGLHLNQMSTDGNTENKVVEEYLAGLTTTTPGLNWMLETTPGHGQGVQQTSPTELVTTPSTTESTTESTTTTTTEATTSLFKDEEWTVSLPANAVDSGPTMPTTTTTVSTTHVEDENAPTVIQEGDALKGHIYTTTTTKNPLAVELNKYINTLHVGMYTVFVLKMMELIIKKSNENIRHLIFKLDHYASLSNKGPQPGIDDKIFEIMEKVTSHITTMPPDRVRDLTILAAKMLEDRRQELAADVNSIFNMLDDIMDVDDAPAMLSALETLRGYPENNKTAAKVVSTAMNILVTKPMSKTLGNVKNKVLVDSIIKAYRTRFDEFYTSEPQRRFATKYVPTLLKSYTNSGSKRTTARVKTSKQFKNDFINRDSRNNVGETIPKSYKDIFKAQRLKNRMKVIKTNNYLNDITKPKIYFIKPMKNRSKVIARPSKIHEYDNVSEDRNNMEENKFKYSKRLFKKNMQHHRGTKTLKIRKKKKVHHNYPSYSSRDNRNIKKEKKLTDATQFKLIRSGEINEQNKHYFIRIRSEKNKKTTKSLYFRNNDDNNSYATKKEVAKASVTLLPSVRDEKLILKEKSLNAMKKQNTPKRLRKNKKSNYYKFSSYSDEEIQLKINIYKAIGVNNDFNNVKM